MVVNMAWEPVVAGPSAVALPVGLHRGLRQPQNGAKQRSAGIMRPCAQQQSRGGLDRLEIAVPSDQRPVNELAQLKEDPLYSWATLALPAYATRLGALAGGVFAVLGGPIAYQTFDPLKQPLEFVMSGATGSLVVVAVASLRIYLGWKYVGDRLLTAALEYEETGWYDGQVFVKPPEVLARDRLLGMYEVRPVLQRLRTTLSGSGVALLLVATALLASVQVEGDASAAAAPRAMADGSVIYSSRVNDLADLLDDDEAAEEEALAQGGMPGYCGSRYLKAAVGGERVCEGFGR